MTQKIIYIEWQDSATDDGVWKTKDDGLRHRLLNCKTVGFLLKKTKTEIIVNQSESEIIILKLAH